MPLNQLAKSEEFKRVIRQVLQNTSNPMALTLDELTRNCRDLLQALGMGEIESESYVDYLLEKDWLTRINITDMVRAVDPDGMANTHLFTPKALTDLRTYLDLLPPNTAKARFAWVFILETAKLEKFIQFLASVNTFLEQYELDEHTRAALMNLLRDASFQVRCSEQSISVEYIQSQIYAKQRTPQTIPTTKPPERKKRRTSLMLMDADSLREAIHTSRHALSESTLDTASLRQHFYDLLLTLDIESDSANDIAEYYVESEILTVASYSTLLDALDPAETDHAETYSFNFFQDFRPILDELPTLADKRNYFVWALSLNGIPFSNFAETIKMLAECLNHSKFSIKKYPAIKKYFEIEYMEAAIKERKMPSEIFEIVGFNPVEASKPQAADMVTGTKRKRRARCDDDDDDDDDEDICDEEDDDLDDDQSHQAKRRSPDRPKKQPIVIDLKTLSVDSLPPQLSPPRVAASDIQSLDSIMSEVEEKKYDFTEDEMGYCAVGLQNLVNQLRQAYTENHAGQAPIQPNQNNPTRIASYVVDPRLAREFEGQKQENFVMRDHIFEGLFKSNPLTNAMSRTSGMVPHLSMQLEDGDCGPACLEAAFDTVYGLFPDETAALLPDHQGPVKPIISFQSGHVPEIIVLPVGRIQGKQNTIDNHCHQILASIANPNVQEALFIVFLQDTYNHWVTHYIYKGKESTDGLDIEFRNYTLNLEEAIRRNRFAGETETRQRIQAVRTKYQDMLKQTKVISRHCYNDVGDGVAAITLQSDYDFRAMQDQQQRVDIVARIISHIKHRYKNSHFNTFINLVLSYCKTEDLQAAGDDEVVRLIQLYLDVLAKNQSEYRQLLHYLGDDVRLVIDYLRRRVADQIEKVANNQLSITESSLSHSGDSSHTFAELSQLHGFLAPQSLPTSELVPEEHGVAPAQTL